MSRREWENPKSVYIHIIVRHRDQGLYRDLKGPELWRPKRSKGATKGLRVSKGSRAHWLRCQNLAVQTNLSSTLLNQEAF